MRLSRVVLPAPKKPVSMVTGTILLACSAAFIVCLASADLEICQPPGNACFGGGVGVAQKNSTCDYITAYALEQTSAFSGCVSCNLRTGHAARFRGRRARNRRWRPCRPAGG